MLQETTLEGEVSVEDSFDVVHAYELEVSENQRLHSIIEALTGEPSDRTAYDAGMEPERHNFDHDEKGAD